MVFKIGEVVVIIVGGMREIGIELEIGKGKVEVVEIGEEIGGMIEIVMEIVIEIENEIVIGVERMKKLFFLDRIRKYLLKVIFLSCFL